MNTIIATRGQRRQSEHLIEALNSLFLPYDKDPNNKDPNKLKEIVEVGVRPIQLWDIAYPKEHHDFIMKYLCPTEPWHKALKKFMFPIRKALGLKKVKGLEKLKLNQAYPIRAMNRVEVIAIGYKDDILHTENQRELL